LVSDKSLRQAIIRRYGFLEVQIQEGASILLYSQLLEALESAIGSGELASGVHEVQQPVCGARTFRHSDGI
jgi:hypothetical protein